MALTKKEEEQARRYYEAAEKLGRGFLSSGGELRKEFTEVSPDPDAESEEETESDHDLEVREELERDDLNAANAMNMDGTPSTTGRILVGSASSVDRDGKTPEQRKREELEAFISRKQMLDEYVAELRRQADWFDREAKKLRQEIESERRKQEEYRAQIEKGRDINDNFKRTGKMDRPGARELLSSVGIHVSPDASDAELSRMLDDFDRIRKDDVNRITRENKERERDASKFESERDERKQKADEALKKYSQIETSSSPNEEKTKTLKEWIANEPLNQLQTTKNAAKAAGYTSFAARLDEEARLKMMEGELKDKDSVEEIDLKEVFAANSPSDDSVSKDEKLYVSLEQTPKPQA